MDRERHRLDGGSRSESDDDGTDRRESTSIPTPKSCTHIPMVKISAAPHEGGGEKPEHLFKKLLVACCDSCSRRASIIPASSNDELETEDENQTENENSENEEDDEAENAFECMEENKAEMHDVSLKKSVTIPSTDDVPMVFEQLFSVRIRDVRK